MVFDVVREKLHQVTPRTSYQQRKMHNINKKFSRLPFSRSLFIRKQLSDTINTWKMAKCRICMISFNLWDMWNLTSLLEIYIMLSPGRHTNNGKCIILIKKLSRLPFSRSLFIRKPISGTINTWKMANFRSCMIFSTFKTCVIWRRQREITSNYPPDVIPTTENA